MRSHRSAEEAIAEEAIAEEAIAEEAIAEEAIAEEAIASLDFPAINWLLLLYYLATDISIIHKPC